MRQGIKETNSEAIRERRAMTLKQIQNVRVMRIRHDREKVRVLL